MYRHLGKRLCDLVFSLFALLLLTPLLLFIVLRISLGAGGPVFFRQQRAGRHGRPFTLYSFRTMTDARDPSGKLLPDAARLTPFGHWLRRHRFDRLPRLFNVLRGELSLIGPRPLPMRYFQPYSFEQLRRHSVRPGLTGWAQLNTGPAAGPVAHYDLDGVYVDHLSLWFDLRIVMLALRPARPATRGPAAYPPVAARQIGRE